MGLTLKRVILLLGADRIRLDSFYSFTSRAMEGINMGVRRSRANRNRGDDVNGEWHFYDEDLYKNFPLLHSFLFATKNEYGEDHDGGSLTLFEKGGVLKFRLHDKTNGDTGWGGSVDACAVFECIEKQLADGGIDWQEDNRPQRK